MEVIPGKDTWTQCRSQQVVVKLSHNRCICITAPASVAQGILWKRGQEDCKSQNTRKSAVKAPGSGCITKTGTMAGSRGVNMGGEIACGHSPKNFRQLLTAGKRRITLFQGWPLVGYPVQSGQSGNCIHTTNKNIQCEICIYIHVCM